MANEDYRIQAYKRVAGMGEGETPVEAPQDSFTPNVAADLVRASMNSPNSIRGTVNGVPVGTGIAVSLGAGNPAGRGNDVVEVGGSAAKGKEKKKKATVAACHCLGQVQSGHVEYLIPAACINIWTGAAVYSSQLGGRG